MENNTSIKSVFINEKAFSLYQSKKITIQEALMLSIITSLDNENGCFATNKYFADNLPIEVDRVKEIIRSLVKKGYVQSTMINNNTKRVLRVVGDDQQVSEEQKSAEKVVEEPMAKDPVVIVEEVPPTTKKENVVPFSNNGYRGQNNNSKRSKFCNIMTHNYDYDAILQLEQQYITNQLNQMNDQGMSDRAKELMSKVKIDEEPSEWTGINQLKL